MNLKFKEEIKCVFKDGFKWNVVFNFVYCFFIFKMLILLLKNNNYEKFEVVCKIIFVNYFRYILLII